MLCILTLTQTTASEQLKEYLGLLSDFRNPIVFSLIIMVVIILLLFLAMRNSFLPRESKILHEKSLEQSRNIRLMALFAELDPDPLLRINISGEIIYANPAAVKRGFEKFVGRPIKDLHPALNIEPEEFIMTNNETNLSFKYSDKYYLAALKGVSLIKIGQIYYHDITELKLKEEELKKSQEEQKEFSRYLQKTLEEERKRISRELHDDIGQKLVFLKLNLRKDICELSDSDDSPALKRNERMIDGISKDIKTIAHSLRPSTLEEVGLYHSLIGLMETVEMQSSIKGCLDFVSIKGRLDLNLEVSIFRILQEAINNIVKYSKASEYNIQLVKKNNSLLLVISDNGKGFDISKNTGSGGMGLRNMRERAEIHGGRFKISSEENEGTLIMIDFPYKED